MFGNKFLFVGNFREVYPWEKFAVGNKYTNIYTKNTNFVRVGGGE